MAAVEARPRTGIARSDRRSEWLEGNVTFVTADVLEQLTGKRRPSAQARWLAARCYKFERRGDGTIVLRTDELDAHTVSKPVTLARKRWQVDLSQFDKES